jgi:hypothetical protein
MTPSGIHMPSPAQLIASLTPSNIRADFEGQFYYHFPTQHGDRGSKNETRGVCWAWWCPENLTREDDQRRGGGRTMMFRLWWRLRRSMVVWARSCSMREQRGVREWPPNGGEQAWAELTMEGEERRW